MGDGETLPTRDEVIRRLREVMDPEIRTDVYTLGLIREIAIGEEGIDILMTLTTPTCPYGEEIIRKVERAIAPLSAEVRVDVTFDPPWEPPEDIRIALGI
jgi:metal-sulfur cluster biosynthetic enzyme